MSMIVRSFELKALNFAKYNPRTISEAARKGLREALTTLGVLDMPVVNVRDGRNVLVAGHQRVSLLIEEGVTHCDCSAVDLSDDDEIAANLTLNNRSIQGNFDIKKSLPELESLKKNLKKPDAMGFQALLASVRKESDKIALKERKSAPASTDTTPESTTTKTFSRPQMVYALGAHRLYCGDFKVGIPKMLKSEKATACVTDPPYNVAYAGWQDAHDKIENDEMGSNDWKTFVDSFVDVALANTDGPCYLFMSSREIPILMNAWTERGGIVHRQLFWAKDKITSAHRGDYHFNSEPILFGCRSGVALATPATAKTNVFEFPKPKVGANQLHLAQKPVELMKAMIQDCGEPGNVVIDLFGGSGTTLIVCEELQRICFMCELDLFNCDTIRKRYAEHVHGKGCDWKALTAAKE